MEVHGIHTSGSRKEITCSDCGKVYLIAQGQRSGTCLVCGNIAFLAEAAEERALKLTSLSEEIVAKRVLPRLREQAVDPSVLFKTAPDGQAVEAIRIQYQVEWQLWAALVKNFQDPAHHAAYLCQAISENSLERASERYREHRSVMLLLADSRWQAEISDLMLSRIETISLARMPNSRGDYSFDIPTFLKALPSDSRLTKVVWIAFGLFLACKFLHLSPL